MRSSWVTLGCCSYPSRVELDPLWHLAHDTTRSPQLLSLTWCMVSLVASLLVAAALEAYVRHCQNSHRAHCLVTHAWDQILSSSSTNQNHDDWSILPLGACQLCHAALLLAVYQNNPCPQHVTRCWCAEQKKGITDSGPCIDTGCHNSLIFACNQQLLLLACGLHTAFFSLTTLDCSSYEHCCWLISVKHHDTRHRNIRGAAKKDGWASCLFSIQKCALDRQHVCMVSALPSLMMVWVQSFLHNIWLVPHARGTSRKTKMFDEKILISLNWLLAISFSALN
jgi:hypothetical protein